MIGLCKFDSMTPQELVRPGGHVCPDCGRVHEAGLRYLKIGPSAARFLPEALAAAGIRKPFAVMDKNTFEAAWPSAQDALGKAGIPYIPFVFDRPSVEPDEHSVGALAFAFDRSCDGLLAVGSGVINDCCKVMARAAGLPSAVFASAPSMDGYASNSSSMIRGGLKVSLYNACPAAVVADTDVLGKAPVRLLQAGLGDMLAKYVSVCEWRISNLVTGEYYCENIAGLMRACLRKVVGGAPKLTSGDADALSAVTEGLVVSGVAMAFAGISRPASGLEHYFSHMWEMMKLDRGEPCELHGIQVGIGTLLTLRLYDKIRKIRPDREKAQAFIKSFSDARWQEMIRRAFGSSADAVIEAEHALYRKNDPANHARRLDAIISRWDDILRVIDEELPETSAIESLMRGAGCPMAPGDIGVSDEDVYLAFLGSRDVRDKYLTSSMLWDLGLLEEMAPGLA